MSKDTKIQVLKKAAAINAATSLSAAIFRTQGN